MSNVKAESPVLDAFESAVAARLAAAADRNHGCMIASRSSQASALPFADVCTNGFGRSVPLAQKLVQMFGLANVARTTFSHKHVRACAQRSADNCTKVVSSTFRCWRPECADVCTKLRVDRSDPHQYRGAE
jgi:hypothetical protein